MSSSDHLAWLTDVCLADRPYVGGKAASLGELTRAGIAVPPGFVVTTRAFEQSIGKLEEEGPLRSEGRVLSADDLGAITQWSKSMRERIERSTLLPELLEEISGAHEKLLKSVPHGTVAVRSSATAEDSALMSFAGLQDTYLWVRDIETVLQKVRACWASLFSVEAVCYRRQHGIDEEGIAMAVVVQAMVDARSAGVMFTRSPTSGDPSVIAIEGAWGLGSAVVSGEVTPDHWVIGKITGEIAVCHIADKPIQHLPAEVGGVQAVPVAQALRTAPCLTDPELHELRSIARRIERHYGCAQDIEWAIDRDRNVVFLLQCRPETSWSGKARTPVARATGNPLDHLMSVFGGGGDARDRSGTVR